MLNKILNPQDLMPCTTPATIFVKHHGAFGVVPVSGIRLELGEQRRFRIAKHPMCTE